MNNDKYTYEQVKLIIDLYNESDHDINTLPNDFKTNKEIMNEIIYKPREPLNDECCGSGCIPCVYDIYQEKMDRYKESIDIIYDIINS